ncbi:hypothetical protein [Arthrobacter sp. TWP1-1]|uniref:hypothetical protein n=1 Tax=Arthrobacter sp. TWP1-1 TaxID=2804568 RepID=UPI003CEED8AA
MTITREIRTNAGYKCVDDKSPALLRQAFNQSDDIDPFEPGHLIITLDPLTTKAKTQAIDELCQHLTATEIRYVGTKVILKYAIKIRPDTKGITSPTGALNLRHTIIPLSACNSVLLFKLLILIIAGSFSGQSTH